MNDHPGRHELGRIDVVTLVDAPALSRDVALDVDGEVDCRVPISSHR